MSFSFSDDRFTALDRVRDAIGDRDRTNPLRSDEEIEAVLIESGTTAEAPAVNADAENAAVRILAGGLQSEYDLKPTSFSKSGGISISWGNRSKRWAALANGTIVAIGAGASSSWGAPVMVGTGSFSLPEAEG